MKSLTKDNSAVSYLLLVGVGLTIVVVGIVYSIVSDFVDVMINATSYTGTPLANMMDTDTVYGAGLLLTLFKYILMPVLLVLIYWAIVMSQKPEREW